MMQKMNRGLSLLIALVMCISFLPALQLGVGAAEVTYKYDGSYIYNWGTRGEAATFLSPKAEAFYTGSNTYNALSSYSGGTGTSDAPNSDLYKALQSLMKNAHSTTTSYDGTRNLYKYTDCEANGTRISSFYSGVAIGPNWDSGSTWNREHVWPNSKGLNGNDENDIMMLRPTASSENFSRGNAAYGKTGEYYNPNSESGGRYDLRGDVARIFLYVYVRWGNVNGNGKYDTWGSDGVIESLAVLLEWMEADPVDTWEVGRNDSVQSITGTRNVFVDYPEFAFLLFGEDIPEGMSSPSGGVGETVECDHSFNSVVTKATCTKDGYTTYTCTSCFYSYKADEVTASGHKYTNGICEICKAVQPSETQSFIDFTNTDSRTVCNSQQQVWEQNSITVTNNQTSGSSAVANYSNPARFYKNSELIISYSDMIKLEINCVGLESKYVSGWLDVVGATATEKDGIVTIVFNSPVDSLVYTSLSSQSRAYSIAIYSAAETEECKHTNTKVEGALAATCTAEGHTGRTVCLACGETIDVGETIPMAEHSKVSHGQKAPSCTEKGWNAYETCSHCDYTTYVEIPSNGHKYGEWIQTVAPGSGTNGEERRDCANCDHYETREVVLGYYLNKFIAAVANLSENASPEVAYNEIYAALQLYAKLTEEEKVEASEAFHLLQSAIHAYNTKAQTANNELAEATRVAFLPIGASFVFLGALWFLLKKKFML